MLSAISMRPFKDHWCYLHDIMEFNSSKLHTFVVLKATKNNLANLTVLMKHFAKRG